MSEIERATEKMTTSEPTTGEIVRALRDAPSYNGMAGTTTTVEDTAADRLESQEQTIAALTARAEQAEAREKAAVADLEKLLGQEDFIGVCWACEKMDKCNKDVYRAEGCNPKWRGLPQEGEGK